ncbi:MAG: hypothetical protein ACU85U_01905 [Gammaproteobacteria bacterium]
MTQSTNFAAYRYAGLVLILVLTVIGVSGCETAPQAVATPLVQSGLPQRHAVRSAELRRIMQRLEMLMQDRVQSDLALDMKRSDAADTLADVAGELAAAALSISTNDVAQALDEAARHQFYAYALELQREAGILRAAATEHRFVASVNQFQRLDHACAGCHSLYRER